MSRREQFIGRRIKLRTNNGIGKLISSGDIRELFATEYVLKTCGLKKVKLERNMMIKSF